jgi:protein-tyrosine phosphatase
VDRKKWAWSGFAIMVLAMGVIQFIPSAPLIVPAQLPPEQREEHRALNFEGISNFRDLGGYQTQDGRSTRWGVMYRSGNLATASRADVAALSKLGLAVLIDFRSEPEKEEEPDQLPEPPGFSIVNIPTLDGGDKSIAQDITERLENGDFSDFDPDAFMLDANRQFAGVYQPQYQQFMQTVLNAGGAPVLWHCTAGKDRAGFAAAILLRILGVPQEQVLDDYELSKTYALADQRNKLFLLRLFKGDEAADKVERLMGVEKPWLEAAFAEIDAQHGDFDTYVREGLGLSTADISRLQSTLLE